MSLRSALASALLLALASAPAIADGPIGTSGGPDLGFSKTCIIYEHANFDGSERQFNNGFKYVGSAWNDMVSSIACAHYCSVTVYEHRDFGGASHTFSGNIQYVGDFWNDKISSLRLRCTG